MHVLLLSRIVKPEGRVYAFEPVPSIFSSLQENIELNGLTNVVCVQFAVSDKGGEETFFSGIHEGAGHLSGTGDTYGHSTQVRVVTLDQFVFEQGNPPPGFIKIDVEGAESKVLSGAIRVLKECRPIVLLDLHNEGQEVAVGKILVNVGYEAFGATDGTRVRDMTKGRSHPDGMPSQVLAMPRP
jgi:FkbM family methyltransferase